MEEVRGLIARSATGPKGRRPIEVAYRVAPGLVVHEAIVGPNSNSWRGMWNVTHERSGWRLSGMFETRAGAVRMAKALVGEADWTWTPTRLKHVESLADRVCELDIKCQQRELLDLIEADSGYGT